MAWQIRASSPSKTKWDETTFPQKHNPQPWCTRVGTRNLGKIHFTPRKINIEPKKWWFPKGISYSRLPFSGSMLNFRRVWKNGRLTFIDSKQLSAKQVSLKVNLYIYAQRNCGAHLEKKRTSNKKVSVISPPFKQTPTEPQLKKLQSNNLEVQAHFFL